MWWLVISISAAFRIRAIISFLRNRRPVAIAYTHTAQTNDREFKAAVSGFFNGTFVPVIIFLKMTDQRERNAGDKDYLKETGNY